MTHYMSGKESRTRRLVLSQEAVGQRALADTLRRDAFYSETGNPVVAWILVLLLWNLADSRTLILWAGAITLASVARAILRFNAPDPQAAPQAYLRSARLGTALVAVAWGLGMAVVVPGLPLTGVALVAVVAAGITAASTSTLAADPLSFHVFTAFILGGFSLGVASNSQVGANLPLVALVVAYWTVMAVVHRRSFVELKRRVETSASLAAAEARYRSLVETASDLVWRVDTEGRWTFVNNAAQRIYGVPAQQLLGRSALDFAADANAERDRLAFGRILAGEVLRDHETVHIGDDGAERHLSFSATPVRGIDGTVIGAQGTARDVSEQVAYRRTLEHLLRQTSLVRSLINNTADQIFFKDADGVYRGCNDSFAEFLGLPEQELVGKTDFDLYPRDRARKYVEGDGVAMASAEPLRQEEWIEGADGRLILLDTVKTAYRLEDGTPAGVIGIARDITELRRQEDQLREALERAEQATRMKGAFLANMSHEIRTPMNGILGMTELLLESELTPGQRESAELILQSAEGLLAVLNDILDFSKIEAGRLELEETPFDLHDTVVSAVRLLTAPAARQGDELVVDILPDVPRGVVGDPVRFRQVLTNLVGNAVKFTRDGEVKVTVSTDPGDAGDSVQVRVSVSDTGIGIAPDKLETIFEEFSQADSSIASRFGGTGLGLTISQRLVELMGGTLSVESEEGVGSTFTFSVPLELDRKGVSESMAVPSRGSLKWTRILLVDDNPTNRRILRDILQTAGAEVMEAARGEAAVEALRAAADSDTPVDLVVMDAEMPGDGGLETIQNIRVIPGIAGTKVVLLTSASRPGDADRARALNVGARLAKPASRQEFLWAVNSVLAGSTEGSPSQRDHRRQQEGADPAPAAFPMRVLLAEDNPVNQQVAASLLQHAGHRVTVVSNGAEALDQLQARPFDVVLMDLQMPVMDGAEATRALRRMPGSETLPVIAITAHVLAEEREQAKAAGMDAYLAKPFKPNELLDLVDRWGRIRLREHPPADLEAFRAMMAEGGAEDAVDSTLEAYVQDGIERMGLLEEAVRSQDFEKIHRGAHGMKSAAGSIFAHELADLFSQMEATGRAKDPDRAARVLPELRHAQDQVLAWIREWLTTPGTPPRSEE